MMLIVKLVVVFVVNFPMVKVVIKGVKEYLISKQPDLLYLFPLFVMITRCNNNDLVIW